MHIAGMNALIKYNFIEAKNQVKQTNKPSTDMQRVCNEK